VNYAGVALLVLGIVLVTAEAFVPSFGVLGIAGIASFVAGSILLMDTEVPGFGISPWTIGALAASLSGIFLLTLSMVLRGQKRRVVTGGEAIAHAHGRVESWHDGRGRVRLEGELWHAEGPADLAPGDRVVITKREGLTVEVAREKASE
jgi:membrane-bound serine protease (ClpP class)